MQRTVKSLSLVVSILAGAIAATPAVAQNRDGDHQLRFGAFVMSANADTHLTTTSATTVLDEAVSKGLWGGGVQAGIEWVRANRWSFGFEGDIAVTSGNATFSTAETSTDYLATLRARAGLFAQPNLLLYATAGVGLVGAEVKNASAKTSFSRTGLAFGGGIEYDRGPWILSAEYLNLSFDAWNGTVGATQYSYDPDMHVFRVGLKFKVGHGHYHDDVRGRIGRPMK